MSLALAFADLSLGTQAVAALPSACSLITLGEVQSIAVDPNKTTEHAISDSCFYLDEAKAILTRLPGGTPAALADSSPSPVSSSDITSCLPMNNIETMLGRPTKFNAGDDAQHANFTGPNGATLQIERAPSDGATIYQEHADAGLATSGWQLAGVDGLGDKTFAADRGATAAAWWSFRGYRVVAAHGWSPGGKWFSATWYRRQSRAKRMPVSAYKQPSKVRS